MADKKKPGKVKSVEKNQPDVGLTPPEELTHPEADFLDDPELLALAAEFDASIRRAAAGQEEAGAARPEESDEAEPDAPEPAEAEPAASEDATPEPVEAEPSPAPDFVLVPPPATESAETGAEEGGSGPEPESAGAGEESGAAEGAKAKVDAAAQAAEAGSEADGQAVPGKAQAASKMPYLGVDSLAAPTVLSRVFNTLSLGALLVLVGMFLLQVLPGLQDGRLLWFSDELRQADVLAGAFNGHWLQLQLNGQLYQEAPPLYFWFLMGLHRLLALGGLDLGADYARLLFAGAAISGLLLLLATYGLARFTARLDRRGSFAAGCVLLSVLFLQFFFHYSSLDLFFAAFIIASHVFMFKALMRPSAPLYMGLAFLCAAVALMSKGALGLALPVLSAVLFCLWRGRPQRLFKGDFLLGLVLALVPAVIWLGSIWAAGRHDVVLQILREQIWIKAFGAAWHQRPWWYYLAVLPALWLPWSLVPLALPWHRIFSPAAWAGLKSARNGERQGLAFVWIFLFSSFALISFIQHKQPVYLVTLMGPLAVITGRAVLQMSPLRGAVLQRVMAIFFFLVAVSFVLLPVYYSGNIPSFFSWMEKLDLPPWEVKLNGVFLLAVIMLGATCLLIGLVKARRSESTLLVALFSATLFSYPLSTMTMPSLDGVLSSKAASVEIRRYADLGYYPISFRVYSGVFSYYSGMTISEAADWAELDRMIEPRPKVLVAMNASRWEGWTRNPDFIEVMRFWMLSNEYVLLLRNSAQGEEPPITPDAVEPGVITPDSDTPDAATPDADTLPDTTPDNAAPGETPPSADGLPGWPDAGIPPEIMDEPVQNGDAPGLDAARSVPDEAAGVDAPGAEPEMAEPEEAPPGTPPETPEEKPAGSAPEAEQELAPPKAPAETPEETDPEADVIPLPDGLPASDTPRLEDPFAPFPNE